MKICPSCRAEVPPQVAVCPFCGARFADAPPRLDSTAPSAEAPDGSLDGSVDGSVDSALPPPRQNSHLLQLPPAPMVILGGAPAREARCRRGVWLLVPALAIVALVAYGVRARGVPLPADDLESVLAEDVLPCGDAPDCVVVYLAPWDDASVRTAEMLGDLREAWAEDGPVVEVIVGAGERADSTRLARSVGGSSWIDPTASLPAALEFETVPAWFRVRDGRVVRRVDGTYLPVQRQLEALDLPASAMVEAGDERRILTGEPARRPIDRPAAAPDAPAADEEDDDEADDSAGGETE